MTREEAAEVLMTIKSYHTGLVKPEALDLAIEALREQPAPPAIDDLPIEDVALIEMWREWLERSFRITAITITLSDGATEYTVRREEKTKP